MVSFFLLSGWCGCVHDAWFGTSAFVRCGAPRVIYHEMICDALKVICRAAAASGVEFVFERVRVVLVVLELLHLLHLPIDFRFKFNPTQRTRMTEEYTRILEIQIHDTWRRPTSSWRRVKSCITCVFSAFHCPRAFRM
jgi:hypothetical protein